ncbi:MAG: methylmalonyl-CoA epimerase [Thermoprotei archaeon]
MSIKGVNHIAIAVSNLNDALKIYNEILGLKIKNILEIKEQGVKIAMIEVGSTLIELLEPLDENTPIGKFIKEKGEGIHHIALTVDNIESFIPKIKEKGLKLINEKPQKGAEGLITFIHPSSTRRTLIEIVEPYK